jgi:hypothetical protein
MLMKIRKPKILEQIIKINDIVEKIKIHLRRVYNLIAKHNIFDKNKYTIGHMPYSVILS